MYFRLIILYFIAFSSLAQNSSWQSVSISDGLSQGMVFDMMQDDEGYIWMTTKNGLNRYDGYNFELFTSHSTPYFALNTSQLSILFEDSKRRLWIGSTSEGLNLYDRQTKRFYHCSLLNNQTLKGQINVNVKEITEDTDGHIWIGTMSGEVLKLVLSENLRKGGFPEKEDFTNQINIKVINPKKEAITILKMLDKQQMLVGTKVSLGIINIKTNEYRTIPTPIFRERIGSGYLKEKDGSILFAMNKQVLKLQRNKVEVLYSFDSLPSNSEIILDQKGFVWTLVNSKKLYKTHYTQLNETFLKNEPVLESPKLNILVKIIYDHQGNIWISNGGYGLFKETVQIRKFDHVLKDQSIWKVFEDEHNRLVYCFYRSYNVAKILPNYQLEPTNISTIAHAIIEDGKGGFWKLDDDNTVDKNGVRLSEPDDILLSHLDKNFVSFEQFKVPIKNTGDNFGRLHIDKNGNLLIIGLRSTVIRFDQKLKKMYTYSYAKLSPDFAGVYSVNEDIDKILWISSRNGLIKSTPLTNGGYKFEAFKHKNIDKNTIADNEITMTIDDPNEPKKYLWIATHGAGLDRMDKQTFDFEHITVKNGLPNSSILAMLKDNKNQIWMSTYNGIVKFDPIKFTCTNFTKEDGLQSDEYGVASCFKSKSGVLMFGGVSGLNVFDPDKIKIEKLNAIFRIDKISINNKPVLPLDETEILTKNIEYTDQISLSHNQNQLMIQYSVIDFKDSKKIRFRYQMEGIDQDWVEAGTNRFANYAQLPRGNYIFKVIGTIDGVNWSNPKLLKIEVNPPIYATWWAFLLYLAIVCYIIYRWYQFQLNKVKLEQKLQFKDKEAARLAELDSLKTQFFTNISHEFRTPLTLLVGPVDDLSLKYPQESIFAIMQRNLRRLQSLINQLLDISKLEAGEMTINKQEADLPLFLGQLFASFESLAQEKSIIFNHSQSHLQFLGLFDLDKLEKIITNLLSNAFKFTPKNGRIKVRVDFFEKQISITVQDFGIGISADRLPHIFDRFYQVDSTNNRLQEGTGIGLALVKELVELLKGQIEVSSKLDQGTTFSLSLPFTAINVPTMPLKEFRPKQKLELTDFEEITFEKGIETNENQPIMLIVEDNPDLRNYISSIFEADYQIIIAKDGEDGLQKAMENIPDIAICDLMMPKLDGLGFCEKLKSDEKTNHIPVIMLTAKASLSDKLIGLEKGADDYISKPFNTEELSLRVRNLVAHQQVLRDKFANQITESDEKPEAEEPTMNELFIIKSKNVIEKYLGESTFDVEQFAENLNISSVQLRRKLKATTNQTVTEFVRNYRLEKAAIMLKKQEGTVSEIAYRVGFESLPYFSKVFQEKFGKTASEWK